MSQPIRGQGGHHYRPTDPNFFGNVSSNSELIFFRPNGLRVMAKVKADVHADTMTLAPWTLAPWTFVPAR